MPRPTSRFMPIYWSDYLTDTRRLSTLEHGAYLLLIAEYWQTGEPLPDDDKVLAKIAGLTVAKWKGIRAALAALFMVAEGLWRHKRIDFELVEAERRYNNRSSAGRAGGLAKAQHGSSNATAMHKQVQRTEDQGPSPEESSRFLEGVSKVLKRESTWTPEQRKQAWQSSVCREAQRTMPQSDYEKWVVAWAADEPWAKKKAEEISANIQRERARA